MLRAPFLRESAKLTIYATAFRYPGEEEALTESEYQEALRLAGEVVCWAEVQINRK